MMRQTAELAWTAWNEAWVLKACSWTDEEKAELERAVSLLREAYEILDGRARLRESA